MGGWRLVGWRDGLIGYKANLSPAKLKLADIGLELSLAIFDQLIKLGQNSLRFVEL